MSKVNLPLDYYEAVNLFEALKVVPDTGDWYNQVKFKLEAVLRLTQAYHDSVYALNPNVSAEKQIERIKAE